MNVNEGEYKIWKTADGTWEVRFYSDYHSEPRHFKEWLKAEGPVSGRVYLVLDEDVRDDEDQIYGEHGYLIEAGDSVPVDGVTHFQYEEFHVDRDKPTSDPLSVWKRKGENGNLIELKEQ